MLSKGIHSPQANRESMTEQGLNPELLCRYLERTNDLQRKNFDMIKSSLPEEDADNLQAEMLQGQLLLDIVRRSCFF